LGWKKEEAVSGETRKDGGKRNQKGEDVGSVGNIGTNQAATGLGKKGLNPYITPCPWRKKNSEFHPEKKGQDRPVKRGGSNKQGTDDNWPVKKKGKNQRNPARTFH